MERWIPITQYAIEEGVSVSTLRRKIKTNSIPFRLDNGRYLIRSEASADQRSTAIPTNVFAISSNDSAPRAQEAPLRSMPAMASAVNMEGSADIARVKKEMHAALSEMDLKWRALEARLNGLAKKMDFLIEQNSELNMLVKVFEEKLNASM